MFTRELIEAWLKEGPRPTLPALTAAHLGRLTVTLRVSPEVRSEARGSSSPGEAPRPHPGRPGPLECAGPFPRLCAEPEGASRVADHESPFALAPLRLYRSEKDRRRQKIEGGKDRRTKIEGIEGGRVISPDLG